MDRGPQFWILVAFFMVGGLFLGRCERAVPEEYRELLVEQFHLPDDVDFVGLDQKGNRGWQPSLSGIVEFTPSQFDDYVASLNDPSVWTLTPFEYGGATADGPLATNALKWWDGSMAIITGPMALFWVNWGHIHGQPPDGGSDVWIEGPRRSLCFAVMGEAYGNEVVPCNSLPANGSRETLFEEGQRPTMYVRGMLDMTERRLFMYVKSNDVNTTGC